jgi:hypothetical protein
MFKKLFFWLRYKYVKVQFQEQVCSCSICILSEDTHSNIKKCRENDCDSLHYYVKRFKL